MTISESINKEYFNWMYNLVCDNRYFRNKREGSYRKLFRHLYDAQFDYIIARDANREADGIDLRYQFGYKAGYSQLEIANYLDNSPCSILEMIVALAIRCEEHIMEDSEYGNRTGQWFWNMIVSLGLGHMNDVNYDSNYVDMCLDRFINRTYKRDGEGGLFTIKYPKQDMRNVEIWYQMCMYLEELHAS